MIENLKTVYRFLSGKFQTAHFEYKVDLKPRYGHGNPPHGKLYSVVNSNREIYREYLDSFLKYKDEIQHIRKAAEENNDDLPGWNNSFLPGLDMIGIYGMMARYRPGQYIEIGSGNSTKMARKVIKDQGLNTVITSIDPFPRSNIDHLADRVIREPFENLTDNRFISDTLEAGDILFIDNSHRVFPNSDAMIFFLEILPALRPGVIVHVHDIYIPYDYPQFMCDRYYNEQYMLAAFIMANPEKYQTILPNYFISEDRELSEAIAPIWQHKNLEDVERHGGSYWLKIT